MDDTGFLTAQMAAAACLCFLCDEGYLFPSLVAAKQAVKHLPAGVDVFIFLKNAELTPQRQAILEGASGAKVRLIPPWIDALIDKSVPEGFFTTHVNKSALYRLCIADLVGDGYGRIVYCDGDIQVCGPLKDLVEFPLPEGKVGAVRDWVSHHSTADMPYFEDNLRYLRGLSFGSHDLDHYFNSGVMVASPATWREVGAAALRYLVAHPENCRLHDQSALNAVCRGRTVFLPIRYNFLRQYMELPAYRSIQPSIVHYVGKIKPWDGAFPPWGREQFNCYVEMYEQVRDAGVVWRRKPLKMRLRTRLKPYVKRSEYADRAYKSRIDQLLRHHDGWV